MAFLSLIGTAIFGAGTFLAAVTTFVLKTVVGIGLSLLAQAIAGKPKPPTFSIEGNLRAGADVPRSFIIGRTCTAGSLVYVNTWGNVDKTPNAYLAQIIAISDLPLPANALQGVICDGERVTLLSGQDHPFFGTPVEQYRKDGKDHMWIKFYNGTQVAADSHMVTVFGNDPNYPYKNTRVGLGVAYVKVICLIQENLFQGFPEFKFEALGINLYDPSKDSSVGGVGPQRWSNPATWGGDGNDLTAVQIYNLCRGIAYNGQWLYGLQNMSVARVPVADAIVAINKCRAPVNIPGGGTEPAFRSGGEIKVNIDMGAVLEDLTAACQGRVAEIGGIYKIHVGSPDPSIAVITDDDILVTHEQSFTPFLGLSELINGFTGQFPNPDDNWNLQSLPPLYRPDFELRDGGRRLLGSTQLNVVPYEFQAQRLLISALDEARRAARKTFTLPAWAWVLEPNDIITLFSQRDGDSGKLYRVDGTVDQPDLTVTIDITEIDPSDFAPPDIGDYRIVVAGAVGRVLPPPQPIIDWSVIPYQVRNDEGHVTPGLLLSWDPQTEDIDRVLWEVRVLGETVPFYTSQTEQVERGRIAITQSLAPLGDYQVRGRYDSNSGREFAWSGWLTVQVPAMQITASDIGPHSITIPKFATDAATLFDNQKQSIIGMVNEFVQRNETQRLLRLESSRASAEFNEKITVAVGETSALAEAVTQLNTKVDDNYSEATQKFQTLTNDQNALSLSVTQLNTKVDDNKAEATQQIQTLTDEQQSLAEALTDLEAEINGATANARFRMTVITAPVGVAARIEAQVRINTGSGWVSAGWAIDLIESPPGSGTYVGRFTIYADHIFVTNGAGVNVLYYDTVANALTIFDGRFIAGYIGDQNGRWRQDMNNAVLKIFDESNVKRTQIGNLDV